MEEISKVRKTSSVTKEVPSYAWLLNSTMRVYINKIHRGGYPSIHSHTHSYLPTCTHMCMCSYSYAYNHTHTRAHLHIHNKTSYIDHYRTSLTYNTWHFSIPVPLVCVGVTHGTPVEQCVAYCRGNPCVFVKSSGTVGVLDRKDSMFY